MGASPSIIKRYAYTYDPAGNRTSEQIDDAVTVDTHDSLNRLLTKSPGGPLVFKGALNEPGRVTINGVPAAVNASNQFQASVPVTTGTNSVTVNAVDASGNATEAVYEVDQAGTGKTFTHDANGNITSDGTRTFEWDARNQLVAVNVGTRRSEFAYDGLQRRRFVRLIETGVTTSEVAVVWQNTEITEERNGDGSVRHRVFERGTHANGANLYLTLDHLYSVRGVYDGLAQEQARYDYDPFGAVTQSGSLLSDSRRFTGHYTDQESTVVITHFRAYAPEFGRWLSQDPLGIRGGLNRYSYVANRPIRYFDPFGLQSVRAYGASYCREKEENIQKAFGGICARVKGDSGCRRVLSQYGAQACVEGLCRRGIRVYCVCGPHAPCGQFPNQTDNLILMSGPGVDGAYNCGGGYRPGAPGPHQDGPGHTLAHELSHCKLPSDNVDDLNSAPEQVAYACRPAIR